MITTSSCEPSKRAITTIDDCRVIELRRIASDLGSLTPVYGAEDIPFPIARAYYLYDVPGGAARGGHAHRQLEQLIVAAMGSFDVIIGDGYRKKRIVLNRAYYGLYLPRLIWREIIDFSSGGICLVLASRPYEEAEYIRSYDEFVLLKNGPSNGAAELPGLEHRVS